MAVQSFGKFEVKERQQDEWKDHEDGDESINSPEMMTTEVDPSAVATSRESSELPNDMAEWSPDEVAAYTALRSKRKKCCVGGCTHRSIPIARSYHQLPVRNKDVWEKWIEVVRWSRNEPDWSPNGDAAPLVCSRHFPDQDFISYEASSRVRLSHTAIPIYYVDPLEGTVMDPRFSQPLPLPPMHLGPRQKNSKGREQSCEDLEMTNGLKIKSEKKPVPAYIHGDNMGYDIEEVTEENYSGSADEELYTNNRVPTQFPYMSANSFGSGIGNNSSAIMNARTSAQSLINSPRSRNLKYANTVSKPPALIRANFIQFKDNPNLHKRPPKQLDRGGVNVNINKLKFTLPVPATLMKQKASPTKHKIGLAKCRLIVQTLENQLKIAKMRLAEQLEIPYQVVHGVWNMRDSLKDKL